MDLVGLWQTPFHGNTVGAWTTAVLAFFVTFTVLPLVRGFISARRRKWVQSGHKLPTAIEVAARRLGRRHGYSGVRGANAACAARRRGCMMRTG